MSNPGPSAERPYSPCTNQCVYDERAGRCRGCHRTMAEIVGWTNLPAPQRERVWRRVEASLAQARLAPAPLVDGKGP